MRSLVDPPDSPEIRLRFEISLGGRREVVEGEAEEETEETGEKRRRKSVVGGKGRPRRPRDGRGRIRF